MLNTVLQSLSLAGQLAGLAELPVEAVEAALEVRVQTVDLSRNRLAAVPAGLEPLTPQLYELNLSNNKLASLPAFLGTGRLLQFLNLANNQLTDLPAELGGLPHLREVALNMNQFSTIPEVSILHFNDQLLHWHSAIFYIYRFCTPARSWKLFW